MNKKKARKYDTDMQRAKDRDRKRRDSLEENEKTYNSI